MKRTLTIFILSLAALPALVFGATTFSFSPTSCTDASDCVASLVSDVPDGSLNMTMPDAGGAGSGGGNVSDLDGQGFCTIAFAGQTGAADCDQFRNIYNFPYVQHVIVCNNDYPGQDEQCSDQSDPDYAEATVFVGDPPPSSSGVIAIPTGLSGNLTAGMSDQLADPGTGEIIAVAVGIPLAFYVIAKLIWFMPKHRKK